MLKTILTIILMLTLTACSTAATSTLLGIGIGATAGALLGSAVGQNGSHEDQNQAILIGTVIGAGAGAAIGYHGYESKESNAPKDGPKLISTDKDSDDPALNSPVTKKIWIPDKLDSSGTKFEKGHWLYLIERQSTWSR